MSFFDDIKKPAVRSRFETKTKRFSEVSDSEDLQRILNLPRRPIPAEEVQQAYADKWTLALRRDNPSCNCKALNATCITHLLPVQGWYLEEAATIGGVLGHIIVGGGKTGIDILLAMVIPECKRAVLLIPPNLHSQFLRDFQVWGQHFRVPNLAGSSGPFDARKPVLNVLKYSELSNPSCTSWLEAQNPDAWIWDEAHNMKDRGSVRTRRALEFYLARVDKDSPPKGFAHSGTMTTQGLNDYSHISAVTLGSLSPLPLDKEALLEWATALDANPRGVPMGAGALLRLGGRTAREGFKDRMLETPGVVSTGDAVLPIELQIIERPVDIPPHMQEILEYSRATAKRPDGEKLTEEMDVVKVLRQLACGFYYFWRYPRGEPVQLIEEWFAARKAYNKEVSDYLERNYQPGMDSPALLEEAARRYLSGAAGELPTWNSHSAAAWYEIEDKVQPVTATQWESLFLVMDALSWVKEHGGIVWSGHTAFGKKLAEVSKLPYYGLGDADPLNLNATENMKAVREKMIQVGAWVGGDCAANWIQTEDGSRPIIASIKAHGVGKNLQAFSKMLVASPPIQGWEQLLGRLHRRGQLAETVKVFVYQHTPEVKAALDDARKLAQYTHETTGKVEKLLYAKYCI